MHAHHVPENLPASTVSTSGLILSLAGDVARPGGPLARRCATIARKLALHPSNRALRVRAADLLADLLSLSDTAGASLPDDTELLCEEFDE